MEIAAYIIVVLMAVNVLMWIVNAVRKNRPKKFPYKKADIFTGAELLFYNILKDCIAEDQTLFAKVRLADMVEPTESGEEYVSAIAERHVDFLVCNKEGVPVLAIELDGDGSDQQNGKNCFVSNVLGAANIKVLHVEASKIHDEELKQRIEGYLE